MKVYLEFTGCRLNQSEIETLARQFQAAGHVLVSDAAEADLCVVNTCAVTREATRSSRNLIRRINRAQPDADIVATGCYAHLAPDVVGRLPGVREVVDNEAKARLVPLVLHDDVPDERAGYDREPVERETVPGALGRTRAFVKVQDGCNNRCTFCITTVARGAGRSRAQDEIIAEINALVAAGYQEAVLTGVHLGSYGHDWLERDGLRRLVAAILEQTAIPRLRLSSLEPWDLAPEFFSLWQDARLCRHLHLPLQSGCDATLRRMSRRTNQHDFAALVDAARAQIPDLALSTDVIAGFPGETDDEFEDSYRFVQTMDFMKLHVFRYSPRSGTAAARMPEHVPEPVKKDRAARMRTLSDDGARQFRARFVGRELPVLWEQVTGASERGFCNSGLTDNYLRVEMHAPRALTNTIDRILLTGLTAQGLTAEPVSAMTVDGDR